MRPQHQVAVRNAGALAVLAGAAFLAGQVSLALVPVALLAAGARRVHLAGSGPALFALGPDEGAARAMHDRLRPPGGQAPVWALVVRTLTAAEARVMEG